jgi:hypothetical protein
MKTRLWVVFALGLCACPHKELTAPEDAGVAEPFSVPVLQSVRISSANGTPAPTQNIQEAHAGFTLDGGTFSNVKLVVDLGTTCFPFSNWHTDPPPQGQNWPADCDAFDRLLMFRLDAPADGGPGLELLRAVTPFGGPLHLEQDVTDIFNFAPGTHTLSVELPTWSDESGTVSGSNGGWNVSARFDATPGPAPRQVLSVQALVDTTLTSDAGVEATFSLPTGAGSAVLAWLTTGHGGGTGDSQCIGPAEEFCERAHHVQLDGAELDHPEAWRNDCDTLCTLTHSTNPVFDYCAENPCGNPDSVRAPRANWCPGSQTPPWSLALPSVTAGAHHLSASVDRVAAGGQWRVSGALFVYGP